MTEDGYEFVTNDRTMGRERIGKSQFVGPYLVKYASRFKDSSRMFNVTLLCIPRHMGSCRAILLTTESNTVFGKVLASIPTWIVHLLSNRFLDSDLIFLHQQDVNVRKASASYVMPASCDASTRLFKRYLRNIEYDRPKITPSLNRRELLDRWHTHVADCQHCKKAHRQINTLQIALYALSAIGVCMHASRASILGVLLCAWLQQLKQRFHHVDFQYTDM
jgi:hypothetical protein